MHDWERYLAWSTSGYVALRDQAAQATIYRLPVSTGLTRRWTALGHNDVRYHAPPCGEYVNCLAPSFMAPSRVIRRPEYPLHATNP